MLNRTVDRIKTLPVLLIVTLRPEFKAPWVEQSHVTSVTLNRLGKSAAAAIIVGLVGNKDLPADVMTEIVERTDGIPLFVEEMTKSLLEAENEDTARRSVAAVPSPALAVPASLHASLMARLDRLGRAKEVAQIGAAIGREFSHAVLAAVVRQPEADLASALDRLIAAGGATCIPSPSKETEAGRRAPAADPASPGSVGIVASEMLELAATDPDAYLGLPTALNNPLLHHTIIGLEALEQMEMAGYWPDIIIGCVGGGSNFSGLAAPFLGKMLREKRKVRAIAAEPAACPSLTRGRYAYDFLDTARMGPMVKMHTLGSNFMPPVFHAGGLRWHGMAPLVSHLKELNLIEAVALPQKSCFEAGVMFARCEGIVPAPEANHAVRAAIDEALKCKEEGTARTILFNLSGHGNFDMQAYADYFAGKLEDRDLDQTALDVAPVYGWFTEGFDTRDLKEVKALLEELAA